ncbi:hypothetical protein [Kordia sp.]|uniref:hypothetical protein n=1 Tax=Kordia sp. TaxID=1965332 RepID=UPI003D26C265
MKSYKDLDVYKTAFNLALKVHQVSLKLPKYELYELKKVKMLVSEYDKLGGKLYNFMKYVEKNWKVSQN